jgi:hypothetical protein
VINLAKPSLKKKTSNAMVYVSADVCGDDYDFTPQESTVAGSWPRLRSQIQAFWWIFFVRLKVKAWLLKWKSWDLNASTFECDDLAKSERHLGCHPRDLLERTSKSRKEGFVIQWLNNTRWRRSNDAKKVIAQNPLRGIRLTIPLCWAFISMSGSADNMKTYRTCRTQINFMYL